MDESVENLLEIPCKILKTFEEADKWEIARKIACYYQEKKFPYYEMDLDVRKSLFKKLVEFNADNLEIGENELQQNMLGLNLANYYHPQMWEVRCRGRKSPKEVFDDLELLTKAIYKRIHLSDTKLKPFNIRKSIKVFGGYGVSNFRPTIAKYIYEKFCPLNGYVLDPCMGYGGRLLGALASSKVSFYQGYDPDKRQCSGNFLMSKELNNGKEISITNLPFEDSKDVHGRFDLVFTSPPYFNTEEYSYDETQSFIRYPTYLEWVEGFLYPLIRKSYLALKPGAYFIINVAGDNLVNSTLDIATRTFGNEYKVKYMRLSKILGRGDKNINKFKLESLYIFKKEK